ncbi:MAG: PAS domain S-box protein [Candidatus Ancaeobacter aquaticus]|nr:PAS domain S-box protein [Candidatus Ancaeobacter aquaticus]
MGKKKNEDSFSQNTFPNIVDLIGFPVYIIDKNYRVVYVNKSLIKIIKGYGLRENKPVGKKLYELFSFITPKIRQEYRTVFTSGKKIISEDVLTIGKRTTIIEVEKIPYFSGSKVSHIITTLNDLSNIRSSEEELKQSEEKYRNVVDNIGLGVAVISPDMEILTLNKQMKKWFPDIDPAKKPVCYKSFNKPPSKHICSYCPTHKTLKDGKRHEAVSSTPDGDSITHYRVVSTPIRNNLGQIVAAIEMVEDVTEKRNAENTLRKSEERYHVLVETANSIILKMDRKGRVIFWNKFSEKFFGFKAKEIMGKSVLGTIVPKKETGGIDLAGLITDICNNPKKYNNHLNENIKKNGERVWVSWTNQPADVVEGEFTTILCVGNDITNSKRVEKRLQLFRDLVDNSNDACYVIDPTTSRILDVNNEACRCLEYAPEKLKELRVIDIDAVVYKMHMWRKHVSDLRRKKKMVLESMHRKSDGVSFPVEINVKYVMIAKKEYVFAIVRDITERKKAEEKLKEAYVQLKETQNILVQTEKLAALGRFSTGIAHEIKNPLGIILGAIEYLDMKMPKSNKDLRATLAKAEEATLRANGILHDLLQFARPTELKAQRINPEELVERTLSLFRCRVSFKNIQVLTRYERGAHMIKVDKNQIQQVLLNIFINAADSMQRGGKIRIHTYLVYNCVYIKGKNAFVIEVRDTGEGISKENMKRLYEPFFTTKRDRSGTGLGLPISKKLVSKYNGELVIESEACKGTTVKIIFPLIKRNR